MFIEVRAGIVMNIYNGERAPEAPAGVEFLEVPDHDTAQDRLLMAFAWSSADPKTRQPVFTETAQSVARKTPPSVRRLRKTQVLGVLGPTLYKAWRTSTDPILMFGMAMFDAEPEFVDLESDVIQQVITQAAQLQLITPEQATQIHAALAEPIP